LTQLTDKEDERKRREGRRGRGVIVALSCSGALIYFNRFTAFCIVFA